MKAFSAIAIHSILLSCLIQAECLGQYYPLDKEGARWYYHTFHWNAGDYHYELELAGDTTINNYDFTKVWHRNAYWEDQEFELIGALREDSLHWVYYLPLNGAAYIPDLSDEEIPIYRFDSLLAGAQLPLGQSSLEVISVDSTIVDGDYRKRYELSIERDGDFWHCTWIDGIGDLQNFFRAVGQNVFSIEWLVCYSDSSLTYNVPDDPFDTCEIMSSVKEEIHEVQWLYPNPSNDFVRLGPCQSSNKIRIRSLDGSLVSEMPYSDEFWIDWLTAGVYFLESECFPQPLRLVKN